MTQERENNDDSVRGNKISDINTIYTEEDLSAKGFVLNNLVGSLRLDHQLDLEALSSDLNDAEYHPETYSSLIYRPFGEEKSISILTPSSGKLAIVGAKSEQELIDGTRTFLEALKNLGIDVKSTTSDILIQNIVANYDLDTELDLSVVALALDLNNTEYEPEQFPGLIYRTDSGSTVLVFGSGMSVITGTKTYEGVITSRDEVISKLRYIGVEEI